MTKTLLPILKIEEITDKSSGEIREIKYLTGSPLGYRFDAGKGVFNVKGTKPITTKAGKELKIIPVAYRIFKDSLFNYSRREWLEIFFLNAKGAVSVIMFHGYSVQHFKECLEDLFYEDAQITDCILTIRPQEKTKQLDKNKNTKYYIAEFDAEQLPSDTIEIFQSTVKGLKLYRSETITSTNEMINAVNYPIEKVEAEIINGEEKKEKQEKEVKEEEKSDPK